ncbi:putative DNA-binding protein [Sphingomonas sp. BE138]|uniref:ribbon-helix-helix domain-containing protein n=1 Tax=Sphingomonas sp. BE138 TaxID=2817845 RepID=UPI002862FDE6|nr:CopG family transcriptional regulator [Sphingomonas sp. BE138]MDR6789131.1 putative DNA-binding protein [Sphingomonas sp. BE138]
MKRPFVQRTVRFDPHQFAQLEELAEQQGRSIADALRLAIAHYISGQQILSESQLRHLRVTEFIQIAMDAIIREDHPDLRDHLIAQTDLRMEQYHGAR